MSKRSNGPVPDLALAVRLIESPVVVRGDAIPSDLGDALVDLLSDPSEPPLAELSIDRIDEHVVLRRGDRVVAATRDVGAVTTAVVTALNRIALDLDPFRLHIHAAAVEQEGSGILVVGESGAGKSTLAAALVAGGHRYLTDELTTLLPGSNTILAYPKPISLDAGSLSTLGLEADPRSQGSDHHLAATTLGRTIGWTVPDIIVFVEYADGVAPAFEPVGPADAVVRLFGQCLDAHRFGAASLGVLAHLASRTSCWALRHGDAVESAALIAELRPLERWTPAVVHPLWAAGGPRSTPVCWLGRVAEGAVVVDDAVDNVLPLSSIEAERLEAVASGGVDDGTVALLGGVVAERAPQGLSGLRPPVPEGVGLGGQPTVADFGPLDDAVINRFESGRSTGVMVEAWRVTAGDGPSAAAEAHVRSQATSLLLEQRLPGVTDLLLGIDVEPIVLKGPALAHDGRLPPHWRDFGDLDLLVRSGDLDRSVEILLGNGFERLGEELRPGYDARFAKSVTLRWCRDGEWPWELDLHRTLAPGPFGHLVDLVGLHERATPFRCHGRSYRALSPTDRFLHACYHAVLGSQVPRLSAQRDVVLTCPQSSAVFDDAVDRARSWGGAVVVARALRAVDAGLPGLAPLACHWAASYTPGARERLYLASYHRGRRDFAVPALVAAAAVDTWSARFEYLRGLLRPTSTHHRTRRRQRLVQRLRRWR